MLNKPIMIITLIVEYFIWAAWLKKDGFYETPYYEPHIIDAIRYTWYRFYFSLPKIKVANSVFCTTLLAEMNKQERAENGSK